MDGMKVQQPEPRHTAIFAISASFFMDWLRSLDFTHMQLIEGIPESAKARSVNADFERDVLQVLLESEEFAPVPDGYRSPEIYPTVRTWTPEVQPNGDLLFKLSDLPEHEQRMVRRAIESRYGALCGEGWSMSGHGWIVPNPDGSKARCGGPGICPDCAKEAARAKHQIAIPALLTAEEIALADKLGECFGDFCNLDKLHPSDMPDFVFHIHALQNILISRAAMRAYPEQFPNHGALCSEG